MEAIPVAVILVEAILVAMLLMEAIMVLEECET